MPVFPHVLALSIIGSIRAALMHPHLSQVISGALRAEQFSPAQQQGEQSSEKCGNPAASPACDVWAEAGLALRFKVCKSISDSKTTSHFYPVLFIPGLGTRAGAAVSCQGRAMRSSKWEAPQAGSLQRFCSSWNKTWNFIKINSFFPFLSSQASPGFSKWSLWIIRHGR